MGEACKDALRVNFDRKLKLEFHGVKVTSDAGLLAYRELDDVFGLTDMVACELRDNRTGKNTQHSVRALLRQSIYGRLAGYEDTNDAERLCVDPAMRQVVGERAKDKTAGSVSQMGRFETEILIQPQNLKVLMNQPGQWVDKVHQRKPINEIILDMDSSDSPTLADMKALPTMVILVIPAIIRCFCSISLGIWNVLYFATAMSIAPMTGKAFWSRWWNVIGTKTSSGIFVAMQPLPILTSTVFLKPRIISMRYV